MAIREIEDQKQIEANRKEKLQNGKDETASRTTGFTRAVQKMADTSLYYGIFF